MIVAGLVCDDEIIYKCATKFNNPLLYATSIFSPILKKEGVEATLCFASIPDF
jgi:hypothetical protein